MQRKEIIAAAAFIAIIFVGHVLVPNIISLAGAFAGLATVAAVQLGSFFRRKHAAEVPVIDTSSGHTFLVKRGLMAGLGWACVVAGVAGCAIPKLLEGTEASTTLMGVASILTGAYFLVSARNVQTICIDDQRITFLPVGTTVALDEVSSIRQSVMGGTPSHIELNMKTQESRLIPGAIFQWAGRCKLNIVGSNGDAVLSALSQRVPTV